jgi:cysteine synthase A
MNPITGFESAPTAVIDAFIERTSAPPVRSFALVEERAHRILPALAALRPTIGDTPLVAVPSRGGNGTVRLKLESGNTTGTVKARTAYALLCAAVARAGRPDVRLIEYSGGSLAVALAEYARLLDLDLRLVIPDGAPDRLRQQLVAGGATVSRGVPGGGFLGAMEAAARIAEADDRDLLLQHAASEVVAFHRETTGFELMRQLDAPGARPVALAAAVGSGGTLAGLAGAFWEKFPGGRALAVFPAEAPYAMPGRPTAARRMNGTGGLGYHLCQPLLRGLEDRLEFPVVAYPEALSAMRRLRSIHGLAVCGSGAGAWLAASAVVDASAPGTEAVALVAARGTIEEWAHAGEH